MNIRRFRVLHEAGASYAEIAGECRVDWRTVKKYLAEDGVRGQTHRTHGEVIAVRAQVDRAALLPLPAAPFLVDDKYLRRVGKDCLVSFEASLYSVPARRVRAGLTVELRVLSDVVTIHALDGELLARHAPARGRGSWIINPAHWDGLPDGHTRATVIELPHRDLTTASAVSVDAPLARARCRWTRRWLECCRTGDARTSRSPLGRLPTTPPLARR